MRLRPAIYRRHARERREPVDEIGVALAPHPRVHASHRRAHYQSQVVHAESLGQQLALRVDHVVVGVFGEARVHAVARLARLAVAHVVGDDDEVLARVERLPGAEELTGIRSAHEAGARAGGAVQDEHGIPHDALGVPLGLAQRDVMDAQVGERLAALELEVVNDVIASRDGALCAGRRRGGDETGGECD